MLSDEIASFAVAAVAEFVMVVVTAVADAAAAVVVVVVLVDADDVDDERIDTTKGSYMRSVAPSLIAREDKWLRSSSLK